MKLEVKEHLIDVYNQLEYKAKETCLKYHYLYHNVNVNVFFDAYDEDNLSLCLILVYEKEYYYTSLNIDDTCIRFQYLNELPHAILAQITVDKKLTNFYEDMEKHILNDKYYVNYYSKDIIFTNTMKYSRDETDLPFLANMRRTKMADDTLKRLNASFDIPLSTLREIQQRNLTLVRTDDPKRRKKLTIILEEFGITL